MPGNPRTVELLSKSTGVGLPASHLFFTFRVICLPETYFWAENADIIHRHIDRSKDVQLVTASLSKWRQLLRNETLLTYSAEINELLRLQLQTIGQILSNDRASNTATDVAKEDTLRLN